MTPDQLRLRIVERVEGLHASTLELLNDAVLSVIEQTETRGVLKGYRNVLDCLKELEPKWRIYYVHQNKEVYISACDSRCRLTLAEDIGNAGEFNHQEVNRVQIVAKALGFGSLVITRVESGLSEPAPE